MSDLSVNDVITMGGGTRAIADALGVKPSAIRVWRHQGYVPGLRVMMVANLINVDPKRIPQKGGCSDGQAAA